MTPWTPSSEQSRLIALSKLMAKIQQTLRAKP